MASFDLPRQNGRGFRCPAPFLGLGKENKYVEYQRMGASSCFFLDCHVASLDPGRNSTALRCSLRGENPKGVHSVLQFVRSSTARNANVDLSHAP